MTEREKLNLTRDETTLARRRLILETAAACFIDRGFHQTSIRDIARAAGISLGNLYNHFENKAALIAEIAALEGEDMAAIEADLGDCPSPAKAIEQFVAAYYDYVIAPENVVLTAEITAEAMRNPAITRGFAENRTRLVGLLSDVLKAGVEQGTFALDNSLDETAETIIDLVAATALRVAFDERSKITRARETVQTMIRKSISSAR